MTDDQVIKHIKLQKDMLYIGNSKSFKKICKCMLVLKVSHQRRNAAGSEVTEMQG